MFRSDRIGDVVLTLPMAEAVKSALPDARVTVVAREYTAGLVGLSPFVDSVLPIPSSDLAWNEIGKFSRALRELGVDIALFAGPRPTLAAAAWRAGIPVRVGTAYRAYSPLFNRTVHEHRKTATRHERDYNLTLLSRIDIPVEPAPCPVLSITAELDHRASEVLIRSGISDDRRFVVLHPGSGGSAKDWDAQRFASLAARIPETVPACAILVTGIERERPLMEQVAGGRRDRAALLSESMSLPVLAAVLSRASLCVANSTGPLHIAAAVGTPVLGLYPFERVCSPRRWSPLGAKAMTLTPDPVPGCSGCRNQSCQKHDRMDRIDVSRVSEAVSSLLQD